MTDTAELYRVHKGYEWAHIFIDEKTGTFAAVSSFGNFSHIWTHRGGETLKEFLLDLDYGYFMGKTAHSKGRQFSHKKTIQGVKETILERRREGRISKADARDAWNDLELIDTIGSVDHFFHELTESRDLMNALDGDCYDISCDEDDPQCRGFWDKIWPEFKAMITPKVTSND